ncbi:MAG: AraC family transcriptional regulator [Bacteroidia bacterium]
MEKLELHCLAVELGGVEIKENISAEKLNQLNVALQKMGLELLEDKRSILVEKTRNLIVEMIYHSDELPKTNISDYISEQLHQNYTTVSRLFSEVRGITIEHYIMAQRIERAKELITYDELSLSEIAFKLHYSSVAHLSNQFKKITGLTPTHFKNLKIKRRIPIDLI